MQTRILNELNGNWHIIWHVWLNEDSVKLSKISLYSLTLTTVFVKDGSTGEESVNKDQFLRPIYGNKWYVNVKLGRKTRRKILFYSVSGTSLYIREPLLWFTYPKLYGKSSRKWPAYITGCLARLAPMVISGSQYSTIIIIINCKL